jgi:hypothetical protein
MTGFFSVDVSIAFGVSRSVRRPAARTVDGLTKFPGGAKACMRGLDLYYLSIIY